MTPSRTALALGWSVAVMAAGAAAVGLFHPAAGEPVPFLSARGQTVLLHGQGLYRYDSHFTAAANRGLDAVTLTLAVPLLVVALCAYRRGSMRGGLLLLASLGYFLYVYASMAFGTAWNPLFLLYVALLSASLFATVRLLAGPELRAAAPRLFARAPRQGPALYLMGAGAVTLVIWLAPVLGASLRGQPPPLLDHTTTLFTYALDLAVVVPSCWAAGIRIWRRDPVGYLFALPLLGLVVLLGPVIAAGTASQLREGIRFSLAELLGPIAGFLVLGVLAVWVLTVIIRPLPRLESV